METIGKRIYYQKATGFVVLDTGEKMGAYIAPPTVEDDFALHTDLAQYNREALGHVDLDYGQYKQEFIDCMSFSVNTETKEIEFAYPDDHVHFVPVDERLANIEDSILELALLMTGGNT